MTRPVSTEYAIRKAGTRNRYLRDGAWTTFQNRSIYRERSSARASMESWAEFNEDAAEIVGTRSYPLSVKRKASKKRTG